MITKKFNTFDDTINYINKRIPIKFVVKEYVGDVYTMVYIIYNGETEGLAEGISINMEDSNGGILEITHE